jgi:hypothetical protein
LQQYFRDDSTDPIAGTRSVVVGKSTSNQRIEKWWCTLRQNVIYWWIIFFKDLRDTCVFNDLDPIQYGNLNFWSMDLIQTELDRIAHEIRQQTSSSVICGKPETGLYETHDFGNAVNSRGVYVCNEHVFTPKKTM